MRDNRAAFLRESNASSFACLGMVPWGISLGLVCAGQIPASGIAFATTTALIPCITSAYAVDNTINNQDTIEHEQKADRNNCIASSFAGSLNIVSGTTAHAILAGFGTASFIAGGATAAAACLIPYIAAQYVKDENRRQNDFSQIQQADPERPTPQFMSERGGASSNIITSNDSDRILRLRSASLNDLESIELKVKGDAMKRSHSFSETIHASRVQNSDGIRI